MKIEERDTYVIDIESQRLYPRYGIIWTIIIKQVGTNRWLKLNPFKESNIKQKILDFIFISDNPVIVGHNILGFDMWCLWKEYGLTFQVGPDLFDDRPVSFIDTLYLSQYLLPDREGKHSLKSWGERFGDNKIDFYKLCVEKEIIPKGSPKGSEFLQWCPEMDEYCQQDCIIAEKTYFQLIKELLFQNTFTSFKNGMKGYWLMNAQSFTGFAFDSKYAETVKILIEQEVQKLREEVEPLLPPRKLKKTEQANYVFPASIYKKDGEFSANMLKFIGKHEAKLVDDKVEIYGKTYELIPKQLINITKPISLDDQNELKEFFIDNGWIPTFYNYKVDQKTKKKIKDKNNELIPTTPKIQEQGKICPNLLELEGEIAKKVVKFLSYKNRYGTLNGWLNDERLQFDGRISAGASGIASTHRMKHTKVRLYSLR